ncbi:RraA family protein [Acetonema longum]|uniref:Putative 4-hydroxy-4-methyl-2-oxoglutarate aldolase n=1 Tax=Acetonema longum DSM 6540 TaxID=1009370 RepID=F7NGL8_9FIRM|nr:RraA family protein [Acetonema longum]EGO64822.1 Dimethylmenaquinone methyltransferase [Acetonema longum DSM 6540]
MEKALIDELKFIPATCISDALQGFNHCDPAIKPLKEEYRICGRAVTVKVPAGDNMLVIQAMKEGNPGDILVVDCEGVQYRSFAGDFVIGLAKAVGFGGVVANGTVRDVLSIKEMDFPVFCLGATLACSKKIGRGEMNIPVSCGGVTIFPGDIIAGDANGVVVIPQDKAKQVMDAAKQKMQKDQVRAEKVLMNRETAIQYIDTVQPEK